MKKIGCFIITIIIALEGSAQSKKIDSLRSLLITEKTDTVRLNIMMQLGEAYWSLHNDSTVLYYRDALQLSEKIGNAKDEIWARSYLAEYLYEVKADYATSLELYLQNIKKERETGDTSQIVWDIRDALSVYEDAGDYTKALEYAIRLKSLVNSGMFKGNPLLRIYKVMGDFRLGIVYEELKKLDTAKKYYLRVYYSGLSTKDLTWVAFGSNALGGIYDKLKQTDSALYYYRVSLPVALQIKRTDIYSRSLLGLANLNWRNKKTDSAFFYAVRSYRAAKEVHSNPDVIGAASLLGEIYYAKKQPDSAYIYLTRSVKLKDSLLSHDKISRVQDLSTKETLQKIRDEQTKKEAVKEYESRIKIYSLLAGVAVLIIFLLILFRNNSQRKVANKKIGKAYDDLRSTQAQLIQSEKMASLGELTAGIAHEIQNPLNFVNNFSEVSAELVDEMDEELDKGDVAEAKAISADLKQNLEKIRHHGKRADFIVKGMLQHSRASTGERQPTNLNVLAEEYFKIAYQGLRGKDKSFNAALITHFDPNLPKVNVSQQDIGRVMLNLFNNAFYAVNQKVKTAGAEYKPEVTVTTAVENGKMIITVTDNGTGIPDAIKDKIMQPFFTTKPTGEGTGLGLSLSYDIVVKGHGGMIEVVSKEGEGAEFTLILPL